MGIFDRILRAVTRGAAHNAPPERPARFDVVELARRLGMPEAELRAIRPAYHTFAIGKRGGGTRTIDAPDPALKKVQRLVLRRLLSRLRAHPNATGFERGHSIVTNALPHVRQQVVIRLDLENFFASIDEARVRGYFRGIGWSGEAAEILTRICTFRGALPQGAPTSPRLSNLVNVRLDRRLAALAEKCSAAYSRYADDITFSGGSSTVRRADASATNTKAAQPVRFNDIIHAAHRIIADEGYTLHMTRKLRIARRHQRQRVTGLVVNEQVQLPRATRRWLRAVEHHARTGRAITLSEAQLQGWRSLMNMVQVQGRIA